MGSDNVGKIKMYLVNVLEKYIALIDKIIPPKYIDRKQGRIDNDEVLIQIATSVNICIKNKGAGYENPQDVFWVEKQEAPDNYINSRRLSDFISKHIEKLENKTILNMEQLENFVEEFKKELFENFEYKG